jgi:hypothetical protein
VELQQDQRKRFLIEKTTWSAADAYDYGAELDLMHAAIAQASGDAVLSQALLAKVVQVLTRPSTDTYMRRWLARLQKQGNAAH